MPRNLNPGDARRFTHGPGANDSTLLGVPTGSKEGEKTILVADLSLTDELSHVPLFGRYYAIQGKKEQKFDSYDLRQNIYNSFVNFKRRLSGEVRGELKRSDRAQLINPFYQETAALLVLACDREATLAAKQREDQRKAEVSLTATHIAEAESLLSEEKISEAQILQTRLDLLQQWYKRSARDREYVAEMCGFNRELFLRRLQLLMVCNSLATCKNVAGKPLAEAQALYDAICALYVDLFTRKFKMRLPIEDADYLFGCTIELVKNLVDANLDQQHKEQALRDYLQNVSTGWSPLLKRSLALVVVAALTFVLMMGLQVAVAGVTPLAALSLVNLTATAAPQIAAISAVVVTAVLALVSATLPRYSKLETAQLANVYKEAQAVINPTTLNPMLEHVETTASTLGVV